MSSGVPSALEAELEELLTHYPEKRSASVMVLHALQDHFGYLSRESIEWTASKLGLQPINILELVTFYPMFRQQPVGRFHFKICRTLSCALGGSFQLYSHLCQRLGLDPKAHGLQTTADGLFTLEFVECLASCGTVPAMMCNDRSMEGITTEKADQLIEECRSQDLDKGVPAK
jgi:NADH-quinone oxidoreductase subunit E